MSVQYDIAIVGGGLVGASLAVALEDSALRVALIEAAAPPATPPAWDERCIALNDASFRILSAMGLWPSLAADAEPILATHISERGRFGVARFSARDAQIAALGYNVPLRAIGAALWARLSARDGALFCPARVVTMTAGDDSNCLALDLSQSANADLQTLSARLVVAADGAQSALRKLLGIGMQTRDYAQHAVVSAVQLARPHQGVAYERFTADGPLALIPKPGKAASLVWTVPSTRAEALLALSDDDYLQQAQAVFGGRLGAFTALGARRAYPLSRVMSAELSAPRTVFIGNAAQSLHPVAAQGFNLGLRDVAALAQMLRTATDPGSPELLAGYAAARVQDRARVSGFTDILVRTFSNRIPGLAQARHWGLVAADLMPGLRERMLRQHLGHLAFPPDEAALPEVSA